MILGVGLSGWAIVLGTACLVTLALVVSGYLGSRMPKAVLYAAFAVTAAAAVITISLAVRPADERRPEAVRTFAGTDRELVTEPFEEASRLGGASIVRLAAGPDDIEITGTDGGEVRVAGIKAAKDKDALGRLRVRFDRRGDDLVVSSNASQIEPSAVFFTKLLVPRGTRVGVNVRGGSISASGLRAGAELSGSAGDITLNDVKGPLKLETGGGTIKASGVDGPVQAETSAGDIELAGRITGASSLESGGGSLTADGVDGSISARSSAGDIDLRGRLTETSAESGGGTISLRGVDGAVTARSSAGDITIDGRVRGESSARTGGGSIEVLLPADVSLRLSATAIGIDNDFGLEVIEESPVRHRIDGTIGDGRGGSLRLETTAGDVSVRRR